MPLSITLVNLLSIDYWTRKSGLAYSVGSFAFGYKTVKTKQLIETIEGLIAEKNITGIVIGMPYNIDGTISPHAQRVLSFAKTLEKRFWFSITLHDERLTSSEAYLAFDEAEFEGDIDIESARLILEGFILKSLSDQTLRIY